MRTKTFVRIAAAFLLAGMVSACEEAKGLIEDTKPGGENKGDVYTVSTSITPDGGGTVSVSPTGKVAKGDAIALTVSPEANYKFSGLSVTKKGGGNVSLSSSTHPYTFTMPAADVTVSAVFEADASGEGGNTFGSLYSVTIGPAAGGTVSASPAGAVEGATVTLTVTPDTGYKLTSVPTVTYGDNSPVTVSAYTF